MVNYFPLAAAFSVLLAQTPPNRYQALKDALGLTDEQLAKCTETMPAADAAPSPAADDAVNEKVNRILADDQKSRLWEIVNRAYRGTAGEASLAHLMGLIPDAVDWTLCLCGCPPLADVESPLRLSTEQAALVSELEYAAGQRIRDQLMRKQGQRDVWVSLGFDRDSIARLNVEIGQLLGRLRNPPVRHDLVWLILNERQRAATEELRNNFELARQAVELGLLYRHMAAGEGLCN
jgi:hypothetical protein